MLARLEAERGPCRATESIQEVIRALTYTMRDVEEAWSVWRSDYVRATLGNGIPLPLPSHMTMLLSTSSGFAYTRARIRAACWRRHQGRPPAAFVGYDSLNPPFRYAGISNTTNQPWAVQAEGGMVTQVDDVFTHNLGNIGDFLAFAQASDAQHPQIIPAPTPTPTHAQHVVKQYRAPPQSTAVGALDYPPPSYPPPHIQSQQQQQPLMNIQNVNTARSSGSRPPSAAVAAAVEVATRFVEAVNKAVGICIELNAM